MIIALAGRRVDPPDPEAPRFPSKSIGSVRDQLRALFKERGARALVSSAASGADLLGQEVGRELGLRRVVVLPYPPDVFRERSVTDRPGAWGALYDDIIAGLASENGELLELNEQQDADAPQEAFMAANRAVLERADQLASSSDDREHVLAVIVWDGASRGSDDLTDDFRREAYARGADVAEISTTD